MSKKIVLIGAGSAQFGLETIADILLSKVLEGSTICLHDINPKALGLVERVARQAVKENRLPFNLTATTNRKTALKAADFCIISIEVGNRFKLWEQDWKIPLRYGSRQVFGENGGPGGLFHSLRIIPPILAICRDMERICPEAYLFNYSNPMARICLAIKRQSPRLKAIGICHEIGSMPYHLPRILKMPFSNLEIKAGGLNHFSVLLEVRYKDTGKDAYPEVRRKAVRYFQSRKTGRGGRERALFMEIFKKFGYLPITTDSHFGEYIHWAWDIADHKGIKYFYRRYKRGCFAQGPRLQKIAEGRPRGDPVGRLQEEWWRQFSGERVIPMIEGILTDSGQPELAANLPNNGLIDNLPSDSVVEVPARVDKKGVHGVKLGALPKGIAALLAKEVATQDLVVEAAITGSRQIALQALLVDQNMGSFRNAQKLLDKMIKLQKPYLSYLK